MRRCKKGGLHNPSEITVKCIVASILALKYDDDTLPQEGFAAESFALVTNVKSLFKSIRVKGPA